MAEIEERLGFRSSFNFVAEDLKISTDLINSLKKRGFEIGVHSIHHKNPFKSKKYFQKLVPKINEYLKEWNAVGFRSPSMYHNLEWIHDLNIEYDASTFDTDPFEPQPDGMRTIFPFWTSSNNNQTGYIELPYTLPQDFLLYILMEQKNIDIWKKKLDWIVENGGMALFITHPDYMNFNNTTHFQTYPLRYYEEFLMHIKTKYEGQYWHALPRDVARFWEGNCRRNSTVGHRSANSSKRKIWIDLDNTPHVPFFRPIIGELGKRGYDFVITARKAYQVIELADHFGLKYEKIGRHYGKSKILKVAGTFLRSLEVMPTIKRCKPILAVSHGSRTQLVAANMLGIPTFLLCDYEYAKGLGIFKPTYIMAPEVVPNSLLNALSERVFKYPGIKEDVYVPSFIPDPSIRTELKIDDRDLIITVRPPATEAHYFCNDSEELFESTMSFLLQKPNIQLVILPRNGRQEDFIRTTWADACGAGKIVIPDHAINGLDLMWFSDLVISGGGTMNREAAALGVPVYSIFRGTIGAVDNYLSQEGRLVLLECPTDLENKIVLAKRDKNQKLDCKDETALISIVDRIEEALRKES